MMEVSTAPTRTIELQRRRMFSAAVEVVSEVGYPGMSMARVTRRAGVSREAFYECFEDREDCFLAVFDEAIARAGVVARAAAAAEVSWRARVRAGMSALLECIGDEPGLSALVVVDSLGAGPRVLRRRAQWLVTLAGIVDEGRSEVRTSVAPPPLAAEGVVGAVLGVLHARLSEAEGQPPRELLNPLMAIVVLPYLGPAAARRELARPLPLPRRVLSRPRRSALEELPMRVTDRTLAVLGAVAEHPRASNAVLAERAGISDQGQISRLLRRLSGLGLAENVGRGQAEGKANAWILTATGDALQQAIDGRATRARG
jgi:AcrR family transcriptional regulator